MRYIFHRLDGWWYAVEAGVFVAGPYRRKKELLVWYREQEV